MDKIAIIFSTITGNAFRLAEAARGGNAQPRRPL